MHIRFDKIDGLIRIYDGTNYLVLLGPEKYDAIYNKIRYLITLKVGIAYRKVLILHNVVTLIKSVLNKDKNHYYYKKFLEKCSYQLAKK